MANGHRLNFSHRLAVYGTLAPGRANAHELAMLAGTWRTGTVRGDFSEDGWGLTGGFPGLRLDPNGDEIPVHILESADLSDHWGRLDAFEGEEYARVVARVETLLGVISAFIYVVSA